MSRRAARVIALVLATAAIVACGARETVRETSAASGALDAYARGELDEALELAERALDDPAAREIAVRVALARGDIARAAQWTEGRAEEPLVRLRAAAHLARDEHARAAALLATLPEGASDPFAAALAAIGQASVGPLYVREGAASAELALEAELALPVMRVRIEAREVLALIATGVHLTVLSPALRAEGAGVIDELALGGARMRGVPFVARELDVLSGALGAPIDAVLGVDVLGRLAATIDGPARRVRIGVAQAEPAVESARFEGAFLAVRARVGARAAWLAVDTAGAFAVAISPRGEERLELARDVASIALGPALRVDEVPLARDVVNDGLESRAGAPIDGVIGWGLLSSLVFALDGSRVAISAP